MAPSLDTNFLPSAGHYDPAANIHPAVDRLDPAGARVPSGRAPEWNALLTAVLARAGAIESAEWALDQAKAACDEQIIAAVSAGVPEARIAEAAGVCASVVAGIVRQPVPTEG